jgi:hypothetical protein
VRRCEEIKRRRRNRLMPHRFAPLVFCINCASAPPGPRPAPRPASMPSQAIDPSIEERDESVPRRSGDLPHRISPQCRSQNLCGIRRNRLRHQCQSSVPIGRAGGFAQYRLLWLPCSVLRSPCWAANPGCSRLTLVSLLGGQPFESRLQAQMPAPQEVAETRTRSKVSGIGRFRLPPVRLRTFSHAF